MKKTLSIHLGRQLFVIEEDAFDRLQQYLKLLEASLQGETGVAEIIEDIEMRFAELLMSYLGETRKVVIISDVERGISSLGEPEMISEDSAKKEPTTKSSASQAGGNRKFYRDTENGVLAGVCSGTAAYLNIDPVIVRILFIISSFAGFGVPLYLILWVVVPNASTPSERLQMHGKAVTVDALKDEFVKATDRIKDETLRARDRFQANNEHILRRTRSLVKIAAKLFGIALIASSFVFLLFFTLTITGAIHFIPTTGDQEYTSVHDVLRLVSPVNHTFNLMWTGILLVGFGVPLLNILFGTRLLMEKSNRFFKINLIIFPVIIGIGILFGVISGLQTVRDFAAPGKIEKQHLTTNTDHLIVSELPHYSGQHRIVSGGGFDFIQIRNKRIIEEGILITYRTSKDSLFHIIEYINSQGIDHTSALKRSEHVEHNMQLLGKKLVIDPSYSYPVRDGFRDQEIEVIIEIPKGKTLTIKNLTVTNPTEEHHGSFHADTSFEPWD
jgi:phage shock protein PspC (stress-responsive transcriptional regulator)